MSTIIIGGFTIAWLLSGVYLLRLYLRKPHAPRCVEVVCKPTKVIIRIWFAGTMEPFKHVAYGDEAKSVAMDLIDWLYDDAGFSVFNTRLVLLKREHIAMVEVVYVDGNKY